MDTVLSSSSYRHMMKVAFGNDEVVMPSNNGGMWKQGERRTIPTVTRKYEENHMRQPLAHERACARGARCECMFIDPGSPFIAVEFLTLEEVSDPPQVRYIACNDSQ